MANEQGKDYRVHIKTASGPDVFTAIGGETNLSWKRSSQEQDQSDKDTGIYGASTYGQQKISFAVSGNLKLPDAGFSAANTASKASPPEIEIQVKKGAVIKFQGKVAIGNFSAEFPTTGPATYSYDMANADVPSVDNLAATV
jgi:predicted secreted protein